MQCGVNKSNIAKLVGLFHFFFFLNVAHHKTAYNSISMFLLNHYMYIPLLKIKGVLWVSLNIASTSGCISAKDCKIPNFVGDSTLDNFPSVVENDSKTFSIGNPRGQHGD